MSMQCGLCQQPTTRLFEKHGVPIVRCSGCGHVQADMVANESHVRSVYGDDYFFGGKDGYPNYLEGQQLLERRGQKYARRLARHKQPGRLLDVGAAAGFILKGFCAAGWQGVGLEPNAAMVEFARRELGQQMLQGTLESVECDQPFDAVTLIQVVAHLHNFREAMRRIRDITQPGSLLLIETWNVDSWIARLCGHYWHEYSPPSVLHWFSPPRLASCLREFGFQPLEQGRTLKWISLRHAASLALHSLAPNRFQSLEGILPGWLAIPYPSEDLFWALYRRTA